MKFYFDAHSLRRTRVRAAVNVRAAGAVRVRTALLLSLRSPIRASTYDHAAGGEKVVSSSTSRIETVLDFPEDAVSGEIALELRGPGTVVFEDLELTPIGPAQKQRAAELSQSQLENLAVVARAATLVKYFHPSDQAATADWSLVFPLLVQTTLNAQSPKDLLVGLRRILEPIAPTAVFHQSGGVSPATPARGDGMYLTRWHHIGLGVGSTTNTYFSHREGRDRDDETWTDRMLVLDLESPGACKRLQLDASIHKQNADGRASLIVWSTPGGTEQRDIGSVDIGEGRQNVSITVDVPSDARELQAIFRVVGRTGITIESLSGICASGSRAALDLSRPSRSVGYSSLYRWSLHDCDTRVQRRCATLERQPLDTEMIAERDIMQVDLGREIQLHLPLAVWTNKLGTLPPAPQGAPSVRSFSINDVEVRLAAVMETWGVLSHFYPYFNDLNVDWRKTLSEPLQLAATATTPRETHEALMRLVAQLRDGHARVTHPGRLNDGILPFIVRRFGDKIVVTGVLPQYRSKTPIGSEILSVDHTPAVAAYDQIARGISAATSGRRQYATSLYFATGPVGTFREVQVRRPNGSRSTFLMPLMPRALFDSAVREPRPHQGTEVASGVRYVDPEGMTKDAWRALMPKLQQARGIILDLRGYITPVVTDALGHFALKELATPLWETPIISSAGRRKFQIDRWRILPKSPHLSAALVVLVGQGTQSADETVLQIIRENQLGTLVGEPSAGTNGNPSSFMVPGGFTVYFTAMRAASEDGSTIHGRGYAPDVLVVPTLEALRAGRDEILEAGISAAQKLMSQMR